MRPYSRVYATVNLDAVASNMRSMRDNLPASTLIMGSVKADGYGHGSVPVAKTIEPYVFGYAVATIDEGIILRRHGINKTILILGVTHESRYEDLLRYDIRTAMFQYEKAKKSVRPGIKTGQKGSGASGTGHRYEPDRYESRQRTCKRGSSHCSLRGH